MANCSRTSASNTFIDLATFSEVESFLYGGPSAVTLFVRGVTKSNWFSHIPITLRLNGVFDFGQKNACASVNRSGDYVLNTWLRVQIPQVELYGTEIYADSSLRWTRNLMHNLIECVSITFNELTVNEFTSYWLDFNAQFRIRGSKRIGYRNMIGDIAAMTTPVGPNTALGTGGYFNVPIPFWWSEDSGVALPIAALPFNDVKINFSFRTLAELLVVYPGTAAMGAPGIRVATINDVRVVGTTNQVPSLLNPEVWATYAVVHNDERVRMGDAPRDTLIYQIQQAQDSPFKDVSTPSSFDLRFSHAVNSIFFGARNKSLTGEWSNYTTNYNYSGVDPIFHSTLTYDSTVRYANGSDYYSLMAPWYYAPAIPDESGYHMISYALDAFGLDPSGSTNYSKLANVSVSHTMSDAAIAAASTTAPVDENGVPIVYPNSAGVNVNFPQSWNHILLVKNFNIARYSNGSLGFAVL